MAVDVIILAAGSSRRFGSDKRLLTLRPVLRTIVAALDGQIGQLLCVLQDHDSDKLDDLLCEFRHYPALKIIRNVQPEQGMGSSLSLAVRDLTSDRVLVFLADMPFIQPSTIHAVLHNTTSANLVAPVCHGRRGHPAGFGRQFYPQLQQLQGDSGAKALFETFAEKTLLINVDDSGILHDIDIPQDWQAAHDQGLV